MRDTTDTGLVAPHLGGAARPGLCTDCGVSRMENPRACGRACQFIRPDYSAAEVRAHGRTAGDGDEAFFGVTGAMLRARLTPPAPGAQWTGITTALAARLLETGAVDAVLCVAPDPADRWRPGWRSGSGRYGRRDGRGLSRLPTTGDQQDQQEQSECTQRTHPGTSLKTCSTESDAMTFNIQC